MNNKPVKGKVYYIEDRINDIENKVEKFERDIKIILKKVDKLPPITA